MLICIDDGHTNRVCLFIVAVWIGVIQLSGSWMSAPLIVALCRRKSTRLAAVLGGLVLALATLFTSFAEQLHQVFLRYINPICYRPCGVCLTPCRLSSSFSFCLSFTLSLYVCVYVCVSLYWLNQQATVSCFIQQTKWGGHLLRLFVVYNKITRRIFYQLYIHMIVSSKRTLSTALLLSQTN